MPCMCGDTQCWSCGPAQGNWRCPICRAWADDGCEHIDEEGNLKEEHREEADRIERSQREADDDYARQLDEERQLIDAWEREGD